MVAIRSRPTSDPARPRQDRRPPLTLGPHARWWARLDDRTRRVLLADDRTGDLPADVWGTCLASAHAEDLIDRDGWLADLSVRRLPFTAAAFVLTIRQAGR